MTGDSRTRTRPRSATLAGEGSREGATPGSSTDVIIVGAGLAGLAAASALVAAGRRVVVLEARDRVGGRVENGHFTDGQWIEVGAQWIGPGQNRMYSLVDQLGLETFPLHDDGELVLDLAGRRSLMRSGPGAVPKLGPIALADLARGIARFNRVTRSVQLDRPWETPDARVLDGQTFRTWIERNLRTTAGRAYFQVFCEAVFSADPSDMSALHAAFYSRSGKDMETLMAVTGGAQQDRIEGGAVRVAEALAQRLGDAVITSAPVRTIRHDDAGVEVVTRSGISHRADQVIVTLPPTLAGRLEYDPPLPSWRDQLTQRVPAGTVFKIHAVYERPFWRERGLNGQAGSDVGPVKVTFDNTPPGYDRGVLLGFIEADDGRRWARRSHAERRQAVIDCFVRYFGPEAREPIDYLEKDWMSEEFSRGCYGAHFAPGVWTSFGPALTEPIGRIHWAGTECSPEWNGYMEGAVRSGEATAAEVLRRLG